MFTTSDGICMDERVSSSNQELCSPPPPTPIQTVYFVLPSPSQPSGRGDVEEGSAEGEQPFQFAQTRINTEGITDRAGLVSLRGAGPAPQYPRGHPGAAGSAGQASGAELPLMQEDFDSNGDANWGWHVDGVATAWSW